MDAGHPQGQLHRPLAGFPGYTMCGELVADPSALQRRRPAEMDECRPCAILARGARSPTTPTPQPDRWHTGWAVQLRDDQPIAHRPDPDDPAAFMCGLAIPTAAYELLAARPTGINECGRCALTISRARKKARRTRLGTPSQPLGNLPDPEQADRRDRARQRGSSVRTVTGGLPGLGKQHH
ncbi:hypothetical protein ACIG87_26675 [Micromonospora sp. NPDC051925]|uniref:hypothetical protein n=1 Tax=Micromonospora sp. NPDC051925 TaxID=3364288 RepID=UPI0037C71E77